MRKLFVKNILILVLSIHLGYMFKSSNSVANILVSQALETAAKARQLKNNGIDVVSMSLGEPDFDTPKTIQEAAKTAIDENYSHYTPLAGLLTARQAVCNKLQRDNHVSYTPENIILTTGAKQALFQALLAVVNPGDQVIIPTPVWMSYFSMAQYAGADITKIPTSKENGYKLTPSELKSNIKSNAKVLMINNPCNPSGAVYSRDELAGLVKVLEKHPDIYLISDEIYEHLSYDQKHVSLASFDTIKERVITINGVSKSFAMTGYRIGFAAADSKVIAAMLKLQGLITSAPNAVAQKAAEFAFNMDVEEIQPMIDEFKNRRALICDLIEATPFFNSQQPEGAFYAFPDISHVFGKTIKGVQINNATDFATLLLEKGHVATISGEGFNAPNNLRLSYATTADNIKEAFKRIQQLLS